MSKKRQTPIFDPQGKPSIQLTTLAYDYTDGHVVPEHFHKEAQLVFASRGVMTINTHQGIWVVPPLRAVWIPGDQVHSIVMSGQVLMRTLYFAPQISKSLPRKCFVMNMTPLFRELVLHVCQRKEWRTGRVGERRVIEFTLDLFKSAVQVPLQLPHPRDSRAVRVAGILFNDPSEGRSLEGLCKDVGGSKRTVERAFIEDTGMTFGKWRQQFRLLHAMKLLANGEKVTTASLEAGYNSPSAFISVFKKALGQTPNRYIQESMSLGPLGVSAT